MGRRQAIADEVEAYLAAKDGSPIPGKEEAGEEIPDVYFYLRKVERWGLPHGQGWLGEPYYFMLDLEWAEIGRQRHMQIVEANRKQRETYEEQYIEQPTSEPVY